MDYKNLSKGLSIASGAAPVVLGDLTDMYKAYNPTFIGNPQQNFNNIRDINQVQNMSPNYMTNDMRSVGVGKMFLTSQKNALEGASAFSGLGPWGMLGGATGGMITSLVSDIGHNTIGMHKHKDAVNNFNNQLARSYDAAMLSAVDAMNEDSARDRNISYFADGGQIQSIEDQLFNEFNNGGSHETNPNGGIPQGFGMNGNPNMVEEGEVKFKDYIFSNRISLDSKTAKQLQLPEKFVKKSYADIAKNLQREYKERQNDPISKAGVEAMLGRLQQAQETFKAARQPRTAPNTFADGGELPGPVDPIKPGQGPVTYSVVSTDGSSSSTKPEGSYLSNRLYNTIKPSVYTDPSQSIMHIKNFVNNKNRFDNSEYSQLSKQLVIADKEGDTKKVDEILTQLESYGENYHGKDDPYSEDAWRMFLKLPQLTNTFTQSKYVPSISKNKSQAYYSMPTEFESELFSLYNDGTVKPGAVSESQFSSEFSENSSRARVLGNFTINEGEDTNGKYLSYYDKYDLSPTLPYVGQVDIPDFVGKPFEIYNRIYYRNTPEGSKTPINYNNSKLLKINSDNPTGIDIKNLQQDLDAMGFTLDIDGVYGPKTKAALTRYQEAVKNPGDIIPNVQPDYNRPPNKYGKGRKNINRTQQTTEKYKGFSNSVSNGSVNEFALGGGLDGLTDPPIVFDPNALRNSDPKLQPQYTTVDNTNTVQRQTQTYTPRKQAPITFMEPAPVVIPKQQTTPIDNTYTTQSTQVSNQEVATVTAQDFLTDFMSRPVQDELYEQELAELNPQQRQLVESIGKETIYQGRRNWSDRTFGTISPGKDYNAMQDWWRDFSQTQKGQEITKFINNPIINTGAVMAAPGLAVGLMAADYADQYGQGVDAGEIGKEVLQDIGTMMVAGRLMGGNQLNMMPNNLGVKFKGKKFLDQMATMPSKNYAGVLKKNIDPKTGLLNEFLISNPNLMKKAAIGKSVVGGATVSAGLGAAGIGYQEVLDAKQRKADTDFNFEVRYLDQLSLDLINELYSETPNDSIIETTIKKMEENKDNFQKFSKNLNPEVRKYLLQTKFIKDE